MGFLPLVCVQKEFEFFLKFFSVEAKLPQLVRCESHIGGIEGARSVGVEQVDAQ